MPSLCFVLMSCSLYKRVLIKIQLPSGTEGLFIIIGVAFIEIPANQGLSELTIAEDPKV